MQSSKNNPGVGAPTSPGVKWRSSWSVVLGVVFLVVVLGVIWLVRQDGAPLAGSTSAGKLPVEKAYAKGPREMRSEADGAARNSSWISFERVLLLAVVAANYLLLAVVAWSYWRARRRPDFGSMLSRHFQDLMARLEAIEGALRAVSSKAITPPAPAVPGSPAPMTKGDEVSRESGSRPTLQNAPAPPVQQVQILRELPSPVRSVRIGNVDESRRSPESLAWDLVNQYCLRREISIVDLEPRARELGLQVGSPSGFSGQRHVLNGPDSDIQLLAIKDSREEKLFVVVGADAAVTESEWLDLFKRRSFTGVRPVRSTRPAIVNAISGDVEEKGELEVLVPT